MPLSRIHYVVDQSEYYTPDAYYYPIHPPSYPMPHYAAYPDNGYIPEQYEEGRHVPHDFAPPPPAPEQRESADNERSVTPTQHDAVDNVTPHDVLCGRGAPNVHHPGNQHFRSLVKSRQREYATLRRPEKCVVVNGILQEIENRGGRFLRQMSSGEWVEVHEAIAYEKTCQALREFTKTKYKARAKAAIISGTTTR